MNTSELTQTRASAVPVHSGAAVRDGGGDASAIRHGRRTRARRNTLVLLMLLAAIIGVFALTLMVGATWYSPAEVVRVLRGETVPGASFTVGELRLPRATAGLLAGFAFGAAGSTFQTLLRNPLASPDIIGISAGASAAAGIGLGLAAMLHSITSYVLSRAALRRRARRLAARHVFRPRRPIHV